MAVYFLTPNRMRRWGEISEPLLATPHSKKIAPCDPWGNVRVPQLEQLRGARHSNSSECYPVPAVSQVEQLSSLLGVPVVGLHARQAHMSADFALETSYTALDCFGWEELPESDPGAGKVQAAGAIV
jgi:hypothetical protein